MQAAHPTTTLSRAPGLYTDPGLGDRSAHRGGVGVLDVHVWYARLGGCTMPTKQVCCTHMQDHHVHLNGMVVLHISATGQLAAAHQTSTYMPQFTLVAGATRLRPALTSINAADVHPCMCQGPSVDVNPCNQKWCSSSSCSLRPGRTQWSGKGHGELLPHPWLQQCTALGAFANHVRPLQLTNTPPVSMSWPMPRQAGLVMQTMAGLLPVVLSSSTTASGHPACPTTGQRLTPVQSRLYSTGRR